MQTLPQYCALFFDNIYCNGLNSYSFLSIENSFCPPQASPVYILFYIIPILLHTESFRGKIECIILFEQPVTAGQLLANNVGAENDLFLNPIHIMLLHCKPLCVRALSAF